MYVSREARGECPFRSPDPGRDNLGGSGALGYFKCFSGFLRSALKNLSIVLHEFSVLKSILIYINRIALIYEFDGVKYGFENLF